MSLSPNQTVKCVCDGCIKMRKYRKCSPHLRRLDAETHWGKKRRERAVTSSANKRTRVPYRTPPQPIRATPYGTDIQSFLFWLRSSCSFFFFSIHYLVFVKWMGQTEACVTYHLVWRKSLKLLKRLISINEDKNSITSNTHKIVSFIEYTYCTYML